MNNDNDPTIVPQGNAENVKTTSDPLSAAWETSICAAVASGRLFILNGRGEFEQVRIFSYQNGGESRSVFSDGYEIRDDDGEVTREWRKQ